MVSEKVFCSIKDMETQGSSAMRSLTELRIAMEDFYEPENIPPRLYFYTDCGGDGKTQTSKFREFRYLFSSIWTMLLLQDQLLANPTETL